MTAISVSNSTSIDDCGTSSYMVPRFMTKSNKENSALCYLCFYVPTFLHCQPFEYYLIKHRSDNTENAALKTECLKQACNLF